MGLIDVNALKTVVNNGNKLLDVSKVTIAEVNAYEETASTVFLLMTRSLNANIVKEEVEHHSDETSDNFIGRSNNLSDVVKVEIENNEDFEYPAIHSKNFRAFAEDDSNLNVDQKKDVVLVDKENDHGEVSIEESFVMKTVRIFKNKMYQQSETFKIQRKYSICFDVEEITNENPMNDDNKNTEDDGDENVNITYVHGEIFSASDRDLLKNVTSDSKEKVLDDDEITTKLDEDTQDTNEENVSVDAKEYSEANLEKQQKFTEPDINYVNLPYEEVYVSSLALQLEKLNMKNILDNVVKAKNHDEKATNDNYKVDGGDKKLASNGALRINSVKDLEADNLMYHDVATLAIFKRFPRFLWRPGDPF